LMIFADLSIPICRSGFEDFDPYQKIERLLIYEKFLGGTQCD